MILLVRNLYLVSGKVLQSPSIRQLLLFKNAAKQSDSVGEEDVLQTETQN